MFYDREPERKEQKKSSSLTTQRASTNKDNYGSEYGAFRNRPQPRVNIDILQMMRETEQEVSTQVTSEPPIQAQVAETANKTGLPDNLKAGIENLSGYSMNDVKVHYNSAKPSQLQAHAYAQGTDIHLAPGQEKHLPHEAWHVVQQMQGRVKPTMQIEGKVNVNDDAGLEKEADMMGAKASKHLAVESKTIVQKSQNRTNNPTNPIQCLEIANIASGTDKNTLMHSLREEHNVVNIDTGHMVISDAIIKANDPSVWRIIADELVKEANNQTINIPFPGPKKLGSQSKNEWLAKLMSTTPSVGAARLKQLLGAKPGMKGAYELYHLLPDPMKYEIVEQLQSLDDFKLGDLGTFAKQSKEKGGTDIVHIVNALGFDPIGDASQVQHLATGIKSTGLLIITAEASGQSVQSLIPKKLTRNENAVEKVTEFLKNDAEKDLDKLPLGKYFNLIQFVVGSKAKAMESDLYTKQVETRHTITSGLSTDMEDNIPTVQLIFQRNKESPHHPTK